MSSRPNEQLVSISACSRPRVLVVDDVEANLYAVEALLDGLDCEVVTAGSGNEALKQLLRARFAVVILDVQMPGMDGYEVAHLARRNPATRDIPIVFLTAMHKTPDSELRGYDTGAVDFLFKPVDPVILRGKVRVFLELAAARQQLAAANSALEMRNEDLIRANEELKDTQAQLIQSAKMASLGKLVAGIAHEINNPLAFVSSHLDTVRGSLATVWTEVGESLSDEGRRARTHADKRLQGISGGVERIRELVVKLRTFSRLDEGERKQVSISECVGSVLTILGHRFEDIDVTTHYGEPDEIECYPSLLNQAVMNLISNAVEAIEGHGRVNVATGQEGESYVIRITDTGSGIPESIRERVIDPFFTTKEVGQGTGLGLSITYSIVKKHGGTLELNDAAGGGTEAIVKIPRSHGLEDSHGKSS